MALFDNRLILPLGVFGAGLALALLGGRRTTTPPTKPETEPSAKQLQFLQEQMQTVITRAIAMDPSLNTGDVRALADDFERVDRHTEAAQLRSIADQIDKARAETGGGTPDQPPPDLPDLGPFTPDASLCQPGQAELPPGTVSTVEAMLAPGSTAFRPVDLLRMARHLEHCAAGFPTAGERLRPYIDGLRARALELLRAPAVGRRPAHAWQLGRPFAGRWAR